MKVYVKYKWLRLWVFVSISFALFVIRKAKKGEIHSESTRALKKELKKIKKTFRKLTLINITAENGLIIQVRL